MGRAVRARGVGRLQHDVQAVRRAQLDLRVLEHRDLPVVRKPSIGASVLVYVLPGMLQQRSIRRHETSLDKPRWQSANLQLVVLYSRKPASFDDDQAIGKQQQSLARQQYVESGAEQRDREQWREMLRRGTPDSWE